MLPDIAKLRWSHTDSAAEIVSPEKTDHGSNADLLDSVISSKHEKDCAPGLAIRPNQSSAPGI